MTQTWKQVIIPKNVDKPLRAVCNMNLNTSSLFVSSSHSFMCFFFFYKVVEFVDSSNLSFFNPKINIV